MAGCNGETVTRIDIYRYAPSTRLRGARERAGTDPDQRGRLLDADHGVIEAYLRLTPGRPCLEQDRADSERMLRAQRFVASAAVTAIPDGAGKVRIRVDVVNEFELIVGGGVRGLQLDQVRIGTLDAGGKGRTVVGSLRRGRAYRDGFGGLISQPGALGRPATLTVAGELAPLGWNARANLTQPFLADRQRNAFFVNVVSEEVYNPLLRNELETASARLTRGTYQAGYLRRIGTARRGQIIGLGGVMAVGAYARTDPNLVRVTDDGLVPEADPVLDGRYPTYQSNHVTGVAAIRALQFRTVRRFDALRAEQDVATGFETTLLVGPSIGAASSQRDNLVGLGLYAGAGTARTFTTLRGSFEGRALGALPWDTWTASVANASIRYYHLPTDRRTRIVTLTGSELRGLTLPLQLSMRDEDAGLLGHASSTRAGGRRLTMRIEDRWLVSTERAGTDFAVGTFADIGQLWAGDVPYGENSPVMASVGISLLGAYPSGGKRIYRLDIGVPLLRGPGDASISFRLSSRDRTIERSPDPRDVRTARPETGPATTVRW